MFQTIVNKVYSSEAISDLCRTVFLPGICTFLSASIRSSAQKDGYKGAIRESGPIIGKGTMI